MPRIEYSGKGPVYSQSGKAICVTCENAPAETEQYYFTRLTVHMPDGSSQELRKDDSPDNLPSEPYAVGFTGTFHGVDGSRMSFETASNTLFMSDGSGIRPIELGAQLSGMFQRIRPVSLIIHESAERLEYARVGGAYNAYSGRSNLRFRASKGYAT